MPVSMIQRGLFLDFDGTLADSIPILRRIHAELIRDWRCHGDSVNFDRLNGLPLREVVRILAEHAEAPVDLAEGLVDCRARIARAYPEVQPATAATRMLAAAAELGFCIAIVSSAPDQFIASWLAEHGLSDSVAVVVGGDSVARGKPDPEPYRLAIEATAADVDRSIAVEDSQLGLQSALAAGLATYSISHGDVPAIARPGLAGQLSGFEDLVEILHGG